jgi:predicted nucleic acid-binding protein
MTLIVDAGPLYGHADASDPDHEMIAEVLDAERESLVVPAFAAAEADYMILDRLGVDAELAFLTDLATGAFQVECLTTLELGRARDVAQRHRELRIGLADASVVVLAARFRTRRILTFDERHFRAMTPLQGRHFTILPADR